MGASGKVYLADKDGSDFYVCTDATTCSAASVSGLDATVSASTTAFNSIPAISLDSTGANIYVYD